MSMLTGRGLSLGYEGGEIVKDISFEINSGDYLCIVGENGAGKSTLMKTILGLLTPISGELIFGEGLSKREVGYLPQQTIIQKDFPASVEEIVLSGCQGLVGIRPFYSKKEKLLARANMEKMSISHLAKSCYRELSGGQQQRVLLARALCATRKMLLLDEPVAGLDPKAMTDLYELIKELNNEGVTVIMISHDVSEAIKYATHILHVGAHTFFGTKKEYIKSEAGERFLSLNEVEDRR